MIFIAFANFPRSLLAAPLLFPVLLAACSPHNAEQETAATASQEIAASEKGKADGESPAPREFAGTAWRSIAGDGARYTTFIDAGGAYRDLRNGEPFQQGTWTWNADGESRLLCFMPDAEGGVERCWSVAPLEEGIMIVTGQGGKRVELEQVHYTLPDSALTES